MKKYFFLIIILLLIYSTGCENGNDAIHNTIQENLIKIQYKNKLLLKCSNDFQELINILNKIINEKEFKNNLDTHKVTLKIFIDKTKDYYKEEFGIENNEVDSIFNFTTYISYLNNNENNPNSKDSTYIISKLTAEKDKTEKQLVQATNKIETPEIIIYNESDRTQKIVVIDTSSNNGTISLNYSNIKEEPIVTVDRSLYDFDIDSKAEKKYNSIIIKDYDRFFEKSKTVLIHVKSKSK